MVASIFIGPSASNQSTFSSPSSPPSSSPAGDLGAAQRQDMSLKVLGDAEPVTHIAARHGVSRKFVYQQTAKARDALDQAFAPRDNKDNDDDKVLFYLPVTRNWIRQFVLALVLIGHTSFRGVMEILEAVFDYRSISLGTIHNIVAQAVLDARAINTAQDLSHIRVGAHDELFQVGKPVLVGADVDSTYCYLLSLEDHRDETTWGVRLLELRDQGLAAAWPTVACHGDVFHAERELGKLAYYLGNRAKSCASAREKLESKVKRKAKRGKGNTLSKRLALARQAELKAVRLAEDLRTLADWMQNDILSLAGPNLVTRPRGRELFDFVFNELNQREHLCPHRIGPVRRMLEHQRDQLLAFVGVLDEQLADIAARFNVPVHIVHDVCECQGINQKHAAYWQRRAALYQKLGPALHNIEQAVQQAMTQTPRASSIVENINSRLRNYFFLRRHIGHGYLDLLRFFLNHRRLIRSERPERVGKTPAELLIGQPHGHWLELLGYQRFCRN